LAVAQLPLLEVEQQGTEGVDGLGGSGRADGLKRPDPVGDPGGMRFEFGAPFTGWCELAGE
jgi:hypothetical protein